MNLRERPTGSQKKRRFRFNIEKLKPEIPLSLEVRFRYRNERYEQIREEMMKGRKGKSS